MFPDRLDHGQRAFTLPPCPHTGTPHTGTTKRGRNSPIAWDSPLQIHIPDPPRTNAWSAKHASPQRSYNKERKHRGRPRIPSHWSNWGAEGTVQHRVLWTRAAARHKLPGNQAQQRSRLVRITQSAVDYPIGRQAEEMGCILCVTDNGTLTHPARASSLDVISVFHPAALTPSEHCVHMNSSRKSQIEI